MITNLKIKNFKSLKNIELELKNLNLFMGLNGMGKSSVIQSLLMLKQSRDLSRGTINLNEWCVQIGRGKDAMYQYNNTDEDIILELVSDSFEPLKWNIHFDAESQHLETEDLYSQAQLINYPLFSTNFQYLKAERSAPQEDYKTSSLEVIKDRQIGIDGYYAIHYLFAYADNEVPKELHHPKAKSSSLKHQVDAWLSEVSPGIKLNTDEIKGTEKILLDIQFETGTGFTNSFKPKNVGFGITYVLPVIIALLSAQKDRLIIIENPESHIHPRGQAELGRLMALSANVGAQLLVETHSDHILNGIRVGVKEECVSNKNVNIFYLEKLTTASEQFTKATTIQVDKNGELSQYPKNMLDEWSNQLFKLM
jgi:predicted ATPase